MEKNSNTPLIRTLKKKQQLSLLEQLDAADKYISKPVHMIKSRLLEAGLIIFAILFNPVPILIMIVLLGTIIIGFDRKLQNLAPPTWEEQTAISTLYAFHALSVIAVTGPLKALTKRPRPDNPKESGDTNI